MSIHVPNLGINKKPTLQMEREKLEKDQAEAIAKAISPVETAVKEKHIRSAIIGTWQEKGATIFWSYLGKMPLPSQVVMCWKAMFLIHKLLREGHPAALVESFKYKQLLKDMYQFWQHSPKGGYGVLISYYLRVLLAKLDFHEKNSFIPGTLKSSTGGNIQYASTNNDDYFQLAVELFDYMDTLTELEKKIFATLDRYRSNSQIQAVQCRICPFPVIIQECSGLYTIAVDLMYRLHSGLPEEVLIGHRERFYQLFKDLKSFYFDAGNMAYVKSLCVVPSLPENPPVFTASGSSVVLKRSSSYEPPKAEKPDAIDPKRQSLMEPLTVAMDEPLFNSAPMNEADMLGLDGPPPPPRAESLHDERDFIIAQLRLEIADLKQELGTQRAYSETMEESLRAEIMRLEDELAEYKRIGEQTSEENIMLRRELEVKEEDKKGPGASEEKLSKLKQMYGKLREEHIQLLRANAEVKKKLGAFEKASAESAKETEALKQELDEKAAQLLETYQKADMFEQRNKEAETIIEQLTNDHEIKVTSLNAELDKISRSKQEEEHARKLAEETAEKERKESELKVTALSEEMASLNLSKGETELAKQTTEENLAKERSEKKQTISSLNNEISELARKVKETEDARSLAEKTIEELRRDHDNKVTSLTTELESVTRIKDEQQQARGTAEGTIERERIEHQNKLEEQTRSRDEEEVRGMHHLVVSSVDEAQRVIQDSLDQFDNPHHLSTTCTADYLLSRLQGTPENLDHLVTAFKSYQTNHRDATPLMRYLSTFSHQLGECLINAKATAHMAPPKETEELTQYSESAGQTSLELLEAMKSKDVDPQVLSDKAGELRKNIDGLFSVAKDLAPKEKDSADAISNAVDKEINATAELVADAAARIEEMLNKTREKYSGVELEVNGRILDSCTSLMQAIKVLILKSKDLQEEIVGEGKGTATAKEFYKRHHRWTEGLISAAKAVGWGAKVLVDSADKVVLGKGKFEELVVASNEITASTAQLVAASRVKAPRGSNKLTTLEGASKGVVESAAGVVASAKTGAEMIEDSKTVPDYSKLTLTQAKRYEMDSQVHVLELESDLTKEREKLGQLRRIHYQLAAAQYEEMEDASTD